VRKSILVTIYFALRIGVLGAWLGLGWFGGLALLWPIIGLIFIPATALTYGWSMHTAGHASGPYLVAIILGISFDFVMIAALPARELLNFRAKTHEPDADGGGGKAGG
jgi:hypothetical protein